MLNMLDGVDWGPCPVSLIPRQQVTTPFLLAWRESQNGLAMGRSKPCCVPCQDPPDFAKIPSSGVDWGPLSIDFNVLSRTAKSQSNSNQKSNHISALSPKV